MLEPIEPEKDPLGPLKTLNAMLEENPPPDHHEVVLRQFALIGIGPGLDLEARPDAVKQGLIRAEVLGMALLKEQFLSGDWATIVNGWRYPPPEIGHYGDDFLLHAADQSLAGIACNDPAEGVYLVTFTDAEGKTFDGGGRYRLHFEADGMPARRFVLVVGDVRPRSESGGQSDRSLLDRRSNGRTDNGLGRRPDDLSPGGVARRGSGGELVAMSEHR